jgi:hypothetical protein
MTSERWDMGDLTLKLTDEEMSRGWHWCWEFDGLLVGPGMSMELSFCTCDIPSVKRAKAQEPPYKRDPEKI